MHPDKQRIKIAEIVAERSETISLDDLSDLHLMRDAKSILDDDERWIFMRRLEQITTLQQKQKPF